MVTVVSFLTVSIPVPLQSVHFSHLELSLPCVRSPYSHTIPSPLHFPHSCVVVLENFLMLAMAILLGIV